MELVVMLAIWAIFGVVAALIAERKFRDAGVWLILGLLFGPFAVLLVAVLGPLRGSEAQLRAKGLRRCPECAEAVQAAASRCRYCGASLAGVNAPGEAAITERMAEALAERARKGE